MTIIDEEAAHAAIHLALPTIARAMADPAAGDSGCLRAAAKARAVEAGTKGPFIGKSQP